MERTTLEFTDLPLIETQVRLAFESPLTLTFNNGRRLADVMEGAGFTDVRHEDILRQAPGESRLISISLGAPLALSFLAPSGLRVRVQPHMIEAEWMKTSGSPYPRFPAMLDSLGRTVGCLMQIIHEGIQFSITNMAYSNLIDFGAPPTTERVNDYFSIQLGVPGAGDTIDQFEVAWRGEIDHRLTIRGAANTPNDPATKIIATHTAGVRFGPTGDFGPYLASVHDFLVAWFFEMLTERAKHEFGYIK